MLLAEVTRLPLLIVRLPRFQYRSNEPGTKTAILSFDTITSATISVDTLYDLRLAQPNRRNKAREAHRILRLYIRTDAFVFLKCFNVWLPELLVALWHF